MVNDVLNDKKRHPCRIDLARVRDILALLHPVRGCLRSLRMFFVLRCLFWLGLVFLALPLSGMDWHKDLHADLSGVQKAAEEAATERVKDWCLKDPATCAKNAAEAADLLGLIPQKGGSQNTLQPADLKPVWRGHGEAPRPARG